MSNINYKGIMKIYKNKNWLYQKYWIERLSVEEVGKIAEVHCATICYWLGKFGIRIRTVSEGLMGHTFSEETLEKMRKAKKGKTYEEIFGKKNGKKLREVRRQRLLQVYEENPEMNKWENNGRFRGGISAEVYGVGWHLLCVGIRERDKQKCQIPACQIKQNGHNFPVHHIDYDKRNNSWLNLITLCPSCHAKTGGNRIFWENYLANIMEY